MPLTRQQKEATVAQAAQNLRDAASYFFISFDGLSVLDMEELRALLYAQGSILRVLPKRLLRLILQNVQLDFDPTQVEGQVAVSWGTDAAAPAKTVHEFAQTRAQKIQLIAGALAGVFLNQEQVTRLALLPGQDQLRGQLLNVIASPIQGLVMALSGVQQNFVFAMKAIADKKIA